MPRDPEATAEFVKKMGKGDGADGGDYPDDEGDAMKVKCPECGATFTPKAQPAPKD